MGRGPVKLVIVVATLLGLAACTSTPQPIPSTKASLAAVETPIASVATPSPSPEPTPIFVRFDVLNGPRIALVWINTDAGADMTGLHPSERGTILAPLHTGNISVDVFGPDCTDLGHLKWLAGTTPGTIVLSEDPRGSGYLIAVRPGVSGTPAPHSSYLYMGCSG